MQTLLMQKRKEKDIMRLKMHFEVEYDEIQLQVSIQGPKDSLYEGGLWCFFQSGRLGFVFPKLTLINLLQSVSSPKFITPM